MMRSSSRKLALVSGLLCLALQGCKPSTDLGERCKLVRSNPDGGSRPVPILEGELRDLQGVNKDFISTGQIDCDDLLCVRDARFSSDAGDAEEATGYCSKQCVQGSACSTGDEAIDRGRNAFSCRALLLSAETLAVLGDGGFPGIRDPYFCVRGGDGGTR